MFVSAVENIRFVSRFVLQHLSPMTNGSIGGLRSKRSVGHFRRAENEKFL